jgi:hypothetical protein
MQNFVLNLIMMVKVVHLGPYFEIWTFFGAGPWVAISVSGDIFDAMSRSSAARML